MEEPECTRCGNEPLRDFHCRNCGKYVMADVDEGVAHYNEEDGSLYEDESIGRGQVICDCGSKEFEVEYQKYCGFCAPIVARDLEKDRD